MSENMLALHHLKRQAPVDKFIIIIIVVVVVVVVVVSTLETQDTVLLLTLRSPLASPLWKQARSD